MSLSSRFPKMLFALVLVMSLFGIGDPAQLNAQKITSNYRDKDTRTINVHFETDSNLTSSQIAAFAFYTDMYGTEHADGAVTYSCIGYDSYRAKWLYILVYNYGLVEDETGVPVVGFRFAVGYEDANFHPVITDELYLTWWGLQAKSDVGTLTKLSKTTEPAVSILQTDRWGIFTGWDVIGTDPNKVIVLYFDSNITGAIFDCMMGNESTSDWYYATAISDWVHVDRVHYTITYKIPAGTTWMDIEVQDPATNKIVETLSILV